MKIEQNAYVACNLIGQVKHDPCDQARRDPEASRSVSQAARIQREVKAKPWHRSSTAWSTSATSANE